MKISVNAPEMEKQRKEAIMNTGKYLMLDITIPIDDLPVTMMSFNHVTSKEVAKLIATLKKLTDDLSQMDPLAAVLSKDILVGGKYIKGEK